jgi:hypothetical protein
VAIDGIILLMVIGDYWWLNYHRLLVAIGGYFISAYC